MASPTPTNTDRGVASRDEVLELLSAKARDGDVAAMVALLGHYRAEQRARRRPGRRRVRDGRSWREIKDEVLARDDGVCHICGEPGATTVDHLQPRAFGGTDDPENCAAAHEACNVIRGCGPVPDRATAIHLAAELAGVVGGIDGERVQWTPIVS